jgi:hypothetical protein
MSKTSIINQINSILNNITENIKNIPSILDKKNNKIKELKEELKSLENKHKLIKRAINSSILPGSNNNISIKIKINIIKKRFIVKLQEINSQIINIKRKIQLLINSEVDYNQLIFKCNLLDINIDKIIQILKYIQQNDKYLIVCKDIMSNNNNEYKLDVSISNDKVNNYQDYIKYLIDLTKCLYNSSIKYNKNINNISKNKYFILFINSLLIGLIQRIISKNVVGNSINTNRNKIIKELNEQGYNENTDNSLIKKIHNMDIIWIIYKILLTEANKNIILISNKYTMNLSK